MRLRHAGARAGRPGAQRAQQRLAHHHRLDAGLRVHPLDPGGRGPLPELGRREAGPAGGVPGERREEAALRQPAGDGGDAAHRRLPLHRGRGHDAQGAGLELRRARHRQGLPALQRDPAGLPEQAAVAPGLGGPPSRLPALAGRPRGLQGRAAASPRPDPLLRPPGRGGGSHLGHGGGRQGLPDDDRRDEVLPRRGRDRDPLHRRHRRHERHARGGARADPRDRGAQGARAPRAGRSCGSSWWRRCSWSS